MIMCERESVSISMAVEIVPKLQAERWRFLLNLGT